MATAIAKIEGAVILPLPEFEPASFAIFRTIPAHNHDVVTLGGTVIVYETDSLGRDGILEGAFYVVESQHPVANMQWESWLRLEWEDEHRRERAQPRSLLKTSRRVVQVIRSQEGWRLRLPSGFTDGPIQDWAIGHNFVGRVVGIYDPEGLGVRE